MGRKADIVRLPQSEIEGREYASDKPFDCRYCYYWDVRKSECVRDKCWYLLPFPKKTVEKFDDDGKLILDCRICPYSRVSPCIGYCIARLYREMKEGKSIVREGAEEASLHKDDSDNCFPVIEMGSFAFNVFSGRVPGFCFSLSR